jgi:phospholipase/lecithinase/hemolysin
MPPIDKKLVRSYSDACKHDWKHSRQDYRNSAQAFHRSHSNPQNAIQIDPKNTIGVKKYDQLVVFGDSLSDTGNLSGALFQGLGVTFPAQPYAPGRFSNGPLWVDQLAPNLGFKPTQVLNFAVAGATTGRGNIAAQTAGIILPPTIKLPGLLDEVDRFKALSPQGANPKALYVVFAGGNDFLNLPKNLLQGLALGNLDSFIGLYGAIVQSVQNIATAVTNLALQGAGTIAIANLPNLGRTPLLSQSPTSSLLATAFTIGFDVLLEKTLTQLEQSLRAKSLKVDLVQVDLFSLGETIANRPQVFGITNLTDPLLKQVNPKNPQGFFYWDDFHPTTQVHTLIANEFQRSLSKPTPSHVLDTSVKLLSNLANSGAVRPIVDQLLAQAQPFLASGGLQKLLNGQPLTV